jgi:hypothetical protein
MRKQAMCPPPYPRARASSDPPLVLLPGVLGERLCWLGAALERGRGNPTIGQLVAVADALQVGLDVDFPLLAATPRAGETVAPGPALRTSYRWL